MEKRTVADIVGPWIDPDFNSSLIERCRNNWSIPVGLVTNYVLATFIRQRIALNIVVPEAQRRIVAGFEDGSEILDDELSIAIAEILPNQVPPIVDVSPWMRQPLSVNEALDRIDELSGFDICVRGLLTFEFEDVSITHLPRADRRDVYKSSIWLSTGCGALGFDEKRCKTLSGKIVVVEGKLFKPEPPLGGCGHMGLWPAELLARTLERDSSNC